MDFRGNGFWCNDSGVELWLYLVCAEIDRLESRPAWLDEARQWWFGHATFGASGAVISDFDGHLGEDADRIALTLELAGRARRRVEAYGEAIPKDEVNSWGTGGKGSYFRGDVDTAWLLGEFDLFSALLRGEQAG